MKILRQLVPLISTVVLSACSVGPDYVPPELEVPERFQEADAAAGVEYETRWWASFKDPQLDSLIAQGVESNKDVLQALSRINQSRALARQALSALMPGSQLYGTYEKGEDSGARFPSGGFDDQNSAEAQSDPGFKYEVYSAGIDAVWEIDIFGGLRRDLEARNADHEGSVASLQDTLRMVISEIGMTYFQLRGAQAQLAIAESNLKIQQRSLEVATAKFEAGQTSELDAVRAKAQLEETRAEVPPAEAMVKTNIHRLSVLLGKQPGTLRPELIEPKPIPAYQGPVSVASPSEMLRRRPDIRMAERSLAAETARIGVAIAELYPKIEITGTVGLEAPRLDDFNNGAGAYRFGPSITWKPFDNGTLRAQVRGQRAKTEEALLAYEQSVLVAVEEVENALVSFSSQRERRALLSEALNASRKALTIAQDQYAEGVVDFLTVLAAQQNTLKIESSYVATDQAVATSLVSIYKALGGGWENWKLEEIDETKVVAVE